MHNFVVYKSSAGSGKTFTLVKEFLRLALSDDKKLGSSYRRILAITFTNKAAAEMKSRVIKALSELADQTPNKLSPLLMPLLGIDEKELSRRAAFVLNHILHHYSDLSIGTIDSFTHKIVKTFAHDLRLPVNFNIELDSVSFYQKVISLLLSKIGEDEYIGKLLKEYALSRAEDNSTWDPQSYIEEFSKLLQKENSEDFVTRLHQFDTAELEKFRLEFISFINHYRSFLRTEADKAIQIIRQAGLGDEHFTYKSSGPHKFFDKCFDARITPEECRAPRITDAITKNKWASAPASPDLVRIQPQLNEIASTLIEFITENHRHYSLCQLLSRQMYPLLLLKKIEEISREQKQEERLVFISEFNQRIYDVINNEPTPFIYERLGERYQNYLLDEFQDTSSLQWQNILPLLDNSLSNGWFNLIVGDGKQSIYRWRNANVKQFNELPEVENIRGNPLLEERKASLVRNYKQEPLNSNYRSGKSIIEFNNDFFEHLSSGILSEAASSIYKDHRQVPQKQSGGYVSILSGTVDRDTLDEVTCFNTLKNIQDARADGYQDSDICILCRTNVHGNTIASFLISRGVNVVSSDSLLLVNNLEVNTILAYLSYLMNHDDQIRAATVVNYLLQTKRIGYAEFNEDLCLISQGNTLFSVLKKHNISIPEAGISLSNLFDQCVSLVKSLGMHSRAFHYIRFFLDEVNEYLVQKNSSISGFLEWWEKRKTKASLIIPDSTNAVRIMTIHASKGLEFPVVIVPYCNWSAYRAPDSWVNVADEKIKLPVSVINLSQKVSESGFEKELLAEQQDQTLDNLNLLYVEFTRAVDRLHILCYQSVTNKKPGVHHWIQDFIKGRSADPNFFETGQKTRASAGHDNNSASTFELEPLQFNAETDNIRIKHAFLKNSESEKAQKQGILLHWLLSQMKHSTDMDEVLRKAVNAGEIRNDELQGIRSRIQGIFGHPLLQPLFRQDTVARLEAELVTANGEVLRPDRINFMPDEVILLDYKTGRENEKKYNRQLGTYELALKDMGYNKVTKYLVYVDPLLVVPVN